ncbi:MAG TPA: glycosyltransferase family 4 protein [Candidatus Eisenbacteria bacterium]|jgi:glycosyltransferase involved in cell wall biosynthesis|nr:glycosyltransferase family 4 protein [Candidatus Eisenbacteria bacterium]
MKIILCKSHLDGPISGADETLVTYAAQLRKAGMDVSVLLMYLHAEEDQYYQRLLESDVPVFWIASNLTQTSLGAGRRFASRVFHNFPGSKQFLRRRTQPVLTAMANRNYSQCRDFLEKQKPDLVHVMTPNAGANVIIRAAHNAKIPVIYQELGIPYHPPGFDYYQEFTSVLPLCSKIAALSPKLLSHCRAVLPHSGALCILPIMSAEPKNGIHGYAKHPTTVTFGFAARMEQLKGSEVLMEAFADLYQQCDAVRLTMAGEGSQRRKIAARAKALNVAGAYRYHGVYTRPEDCRAFMENLDVFVMPSFSEGTPNSIVEAMACGKPIIASDVGGIPDMIGADAGISVVAGDTKALTSAMLQLATDANLRQRLGIAARERYERFFSPEVVLPFMTDIYEKVITNGNGDRLAISCNGNQHPWSE